MALGCPQVHLLAASEAQKSSDFSWHVSSWWCLSLLYLVQVSNITNYALDLLTQAGVELVPFDSQALNDVSANAWGSSTESYAYEDTDTLAR